MVLLTSGQVSVAISSFVVFLFTSALFLSGYVLQQQTVRDLRAAIKPKPTPEAARMYLPKKFALQLETEARLEVGQTDMKEGGIDVEVVESTGSRDGQLYGKEPLMDESLPQVGESDVGVQKPLGVEHPDIIENESSTKNAKPSEVEPLSKAERRKKIKEEILAAGEGDGFKGYKRRQW